jgi:hypothetical protein
MDWGAGFLALLKLLGALSDYLGRRQLLAAGQAQAIAAGLQGTIDNLSEARRAADAVTHPTGPGDAGYARRVRERYTRPDK